MRLEHRVQVFDAAQMVAEFGLADHANQSRRILRSRRDTFGIPTTRLESSEATDPRVSLIESRHPLPFITSLPLFPSLRVLPARSLLTYGDRQPIRIEIWAVRAPKVSVGS